jgi:hypothetical protein
MALLPLVGGQRAQKDIDGHVHRAGLLALGDMQNSLRDGHLAIARDHVHVVGLDAGIVFYLGDRQWK